MPDAHVVIYIAALNRNEEALIVAERGRTRAFVDLLLERQGYHPENSHRLRHKADRGSSIPHIDDYSNGINNLDQMLEVVNRQRAVVLYYSFAAGYLFAWLIVPNKGKLLSYDSKLTVILIILFAIRCRKVSPNIFIGVNIRNI